MNFSLLTLSSNAVHSHKTDVLLVLVPEGLKPARGPLADWMTRQLKSGDFSTQVGFQVSLFESPGWAAKRVCLVGMGSGGAAQVRQALTAGEPNDHFAVAVQPGKGADHGHKQAECEDGW